MFVHNGIGYETLENYATAVKADLDAAFLQIGEHETAFEYDHKIMDDFAREFWPDEEGKTWAAGFSLGKLMEMCRDEMNRKNRLIDDIRKAVDVGPPWTDAIGSIRLILKQTERPKCACAIANGMVTNRGSCPVHSQDVAEKRKCEPAPGKHQDGCRCSRCWSQNLG